jgi:multidrug efflux pump
LQSKIVYDATEYIRSSIKEVVFTLIEAAGIVILVIFLFIGSLRAVLIPVLTIPLSMIGVGLFMLVMGYSINLLTLLAMVLAIGLVVDDAIVVVENINRHIEEGRPPLEAALEGAREIALPVVAMTLTLAAVYAPIGFMGGLTGSLFQEFALTLAGAVLISGVIALTLSPMMCSKILSSHQGRFMRFVDRQFSRLRGHYRQRLHGALNYPPVTGLFVVTVLISCYFLYTGAQQELAPQEDQGFLIALSTGPQNATHDYMTRFTGRFGELYESLPETGDYFLVNGLGAANIAISAIVLKRWEQRERGQMEVQPEMQAKLDTVSGVQSAAFAVPSLPGASGLPIQFVITTTDDYKVLYEVSQKILEAAQKSGLFIFVETDLKFANRQVKLLIDRAKAAELGLSMADIGNTLGLLLGGGYLNRFEMEGRGYKVIPQVIQDFRAVPELLLDYRVRAADDTLIPLSTVVKLDYEVQPNQLNQFQQLNAATLSGVMTPGVAVGQALAFLQQEAAKSLPQGYGTDYMGQSRQFVQEGSAMMLTFMFALLVIFLVLAAQFESFRDPLVVMFSVPMSLCGALIFINLGLASVNIYTQVGLVTLIGLISKHGILMVEFANELQRKQGLRKRQAIEEAAAIRLRPILMTTGAMVLGVLPLLTATGAGAVSRFAIGLTVAAGMSIGTLFTLFVVPAMYLWLGQEHRQAEAMPRLVENAGVD